MAKTFWHPVFVELMKLSLGDYYTIDPEVSVSDLPRRADMMVVRRQEGPEPPFRGLWNHLADWNVIEFKGPTDAPEEIDLELLWHVGSGLTVRLSEERKARKEDTLPNREIAFWYIAPYLGDTFLAAARDRGRFDYEAGGLYRGRIWSHPLYLVSSRDVPVEVDTIPIHLIRRDAPAPRGVGELVVGSEERVRRFLTWVRALQPNMYEEIKTMAGTKGILDWETLSKYENLAEVIPFIPPDRVVEMLGASRAIRLGLSRLMSGEEQILEEALADIPAEQLEQLERLLQKRRSQSPSSPPDPSPKAE